MATFHYILDSITALLEQFEAGILPKENWTHEAHLVVAIWYSVKHDEQKSLEITRERIKTYNEAIGTLNSDHSGYHETITCFWLWVAREFIAGHPGKTLTALCSDFILSEYSDRGFPLRYYSRQVLFSAHARLNRVEPDVSPLETLPPPCRVNTQ